MDLFFNELSLHVASDRFAANQWFEALGGLYKNAASLGLGEIKVPEVFFQHSFTDRYTFFQWIDDKGFDADLRLLLKSKITTTPVIEAMLKEKETSISRVFDCLYRGQNALGLGAASPYMFNALSISMVSDSIWDEAYIGVNITIFDGEDLNEEACDIRHIYQNLHLNIHTVWLQAQKRPNVPNGQVLWLKRNTLFPNLIFCDHVRGQISGFSGNQPEFIQMQKRLYELEEYASKRQAGVFNAEALPSKVTPESITRGNEFASKLIRDCPDGKTRFFDWHARFTPGAGRIHFFPLEDSNKIIIGNIANQNEIK